MEITINPRLVAFCGLYCGACGRYLKNKCPGCVGNEKAAWCSVRTCCLENHFSSCAECRDFTDISLCKKFNNIFSKIFGFIFRSDRKACIQRIRETGIESYAREMTEKKIHSIKR